MPRKLPYRTAIWKVYIPVDVAARVELRVGSGYGRRSRLLQKLLEDWLVEGDKTFDLDAEELPSLPFGDSNATS